MKCVHSVYIAAWYIVYYTFCVHCSVYTLYISQNIHLTLESTVVYE